MVKDLTKMSDDVTTVIFEDNKLFNLQVNYCYELNMVVIHKTFKKTGIIHTLQLSIPEYEMLLARPIG